MMTRNDSWRLQRGMDRGQSLWRTILGNISATDKVHHFTNCNFDDDLLPIPDKESLPFELDNTTSQKFLAAQERVLRPYSDFELAEDFDEHELRHIGEGKLDSEIQRVTRVGGGGYADVYVARLAKNNKTMAVKLFKRPPQEDNSGVSWRGYGNVGKPDNVCQYPYPTLRAFRNEKFHLEDISNWLSKLDHGNIGKAIGEAHVIHIQRSFTTEKHHGLVLLPIAACDLEHLLQEYSHSVTENKPSVTIRGEYEVKKSDVTQWLWQYFACIASIVHMLHSRRIRHDDITPKNLLCGRVDGSVLIDGIIRICDFGTSMKVGTPWRNHRESGYTKLSVDDAREAVQ